MTYYAIFERMIEGNYAQWLLDEVRDLQENPEFVPPSLLAAVQEWVAAVDDARKIKRASLRQQQAFRAGRKVWAALNGIEYYRDIKAPGKFELVQGVDWLGAFDSHDEAISAAKRHFVSLKRPAAGPSSPAPLTQAEAVVAPLLSAMIALRPNPDLTQEGVQVVPQGGHSGGGYSVKEYLLLDPLDDSGGRFYEIWEATN